MTCGWRKQKRINLTDLSVMDCGHCHSSSTVTDVHRCDCVPLRVVWLLIACCVSARVHLCGVRITQHTHTHSPVSGCGMGWMSVLCEITVRCWIMIKPLVNVMLLCELCTALWFGLICAFSPDETPNLGSFWQRWHTGWTWKTPLLHFLCACCDPTFSKIDACYFCCLPRCAPSYFQPLYVPLGVLRDFCCSVKSAAALMARPSRAVIQTSKLLEYKSRPEFALAGRSSRGHRDYLFIWNLSGQGGLLSAGDSGTTRHRHLICAVACHAHWGLHKCGSEEVLYLSGGGRVLGTLYGSLLTTKLFNECKAYDKTACKLRFVKERSDFSATSSLWHKAVFQCAPSAFLCVLKTVSRKCSSVLLLSIQTENCIKNEMQHCKAVPGSSFC